jgi:hypothetical protein
MVNKNRGLKPSVRAMSEFLIHPLMLAMSWIEANGAGICGIYWVSLLRRSGDKGFRDSNNKCIFYFLKCSSDKGYRDFKCKGFVADKSGKCCYDRVTG